MGSKLMLVPRPDGSGSVARVAILRHDGTTAEVIEIDPLYKNPKLLRPLNPGFTFAVRFWDWAGTFAFWGSIIASFLWHWWVFLPGFLIAWSIWRLNRKSVGDFLHQSLREKPDSLAYLRSLNLVWTADLSKIMPDRT